MKHTTQKITVSNDEVTAVTNVETIVADTATQIGHIDQERNARSSKSANL